jgi:AraC-like DNA-binding protein
MPDQTPSNTMEAIAYRGAAIGQSYEMWREQVCRGFCRLDIEPSKGTRIDCEIKLASLSDLALRTVDGISGQFGRTRELLSDGCDDFALISATRDPIHVTQAGKSISLSQSQMCLRDMSVAGAVAFEGTNQFTGIRIPRRALLAVCPGAEDRLLLTLHENPALLAMIARYYELSTELAHKLDAAGQRLTAQHLVDLVGLLLGSDGEEKDLATQRGYAAARVELMKRDIVTNIKRPDLTIGSISQSHGLSPRQAQRLFAEAGTTFSEFVTEQRLLLARRLLAEPRHRRSKVSAIAHTAGFGDLSYFNRIFRKRFGVTPSDMRADLVNAHGSLENHGVHSR